MSYFPQLQSLLAPISSLTASCNLQHGKASALNNVLTIFHSITLWSFGDSHGKSKFYLLILDAIDIC